LVPRPPGCRVERMRTIGARDALLWNLVDPGSWASPTCRNDKKTV
jgi:hypothetical protein